MRPRATPRNQWAAHRHSCRAAGLGQPQGEEGRDGRRDLRHLLGEEEQQASTAARVRDYGRDAAFTRKLAFTLIITLIAVVMTRTPGYDKRLFNSGLGLQYPDL